MVLWCFSICRLCTFSFFPSICFLVSPDAEFLSQGQAHLQRARELARHPHYGGCWTGALAQVNVGCRELDEEQQSRIALAFAHCHLQRSGRRFPPCEPSSTIRHCTQHMDPVAFGVYTEFFTHAHSICYFLYSEAWQQRAQGTVQRLTSASETVARQLESTNRLAEEAARAQNATLHSQEQILKDGELLRQTLHDSSRGIRQSFKELQDSAVEQRVAFAEIFNRVSFLHHFVVGESNALYSVFFHLLSGAACLVLTSSQRTAGARFILLALVGANVYLERVICSLLMDNLEGGYDLTESISFWIGLSRRSFASLGLAIVVYFIWTYKDPARQNREVLRCLQNTQTEIQQLLERTEKLLAKPGLLLQDSDLNVKNEVFTDLTFPEPLPCSEYGATLQVTQLQADKRESECYIQGRAGRQHKKNSLVEAVLPSSSKRRRHSPYHTPHSLSRHEKVATPLLTTHVSLEKAFQYNLRSRRSLGSPTCH